MRRGFSRATIALEAPMNVKRAAVLGVGCAALAVWLAAAATSGTRQQPAHTPAAAAVELQGEELAAEIARLRERLRPTTAPSQTRDLFNYAARGPSRARVARPPGAAQPPAVVPPPVVNRPTLKLIGIAEDDGSGNVVRTAIISGLGDVFLVKEGEAIALQYRVLRIGADAVELTDVGDGTSFRLALN
jgi:hypothetical protein